MVLTSLTRALLARCFRPFKFYLRGQISKNTEVGRWIEMLASLEANLTIVEIGTWNGLGSTKMILRGLKKRKLDKIQVIGFETNKRMYGVAKRNLKRHDLYQLVWGSIIQEGELDMTNLSETESNWIKTDLEDMRKAPYVFKKVPENIDLLILDGGEFSTYAEFQKLNSRVSGWIILDDTNSRKCARILREVPAEGTWNVIFQSDERNGTAVLRKISYKKDS